MSEPKQLTSTQLWLLHAWLYAPTALAGSVLMGLILTRSHSWLNRIPVCICLFVATLLVMGNIQSRGEKHDPADLLSQMVKVAFGLLLPLLLRDGVRLAEGRHASLQDNLLIDLGGPLLFAPFSVLFTSEKKKKEKVREAKA